MSKEANLAVVRSFFDRALNKGETDGLEVLVSGDVAVAQSAPGIEGMRRLLSETKAAFSSPEYKLVDSVAEGEKVVVRFSAKATHSGKYMGIPASGKALSLWGVMIFGFQAGAIAEFWWLMDAQSILRQLRGP
jgi:steroid delta-isomerase-like uncharacterized protein